ncbi:thrombospondin type 3 repeat-containing protein [Patescibacteria group bacterium]|nr:thrombospondin type 3 repeat-containing protein [Patescibacteria group bacterium]
MPQPQPMQPEQPPQPAPNAPASEEEMDIFSDQPANNQIPAAPQAPDSMQQTILTPKEQEELFKREKLSTIQKVILVIIALVVIAGLVGGGIWLYLTLVSNDTNEGAATEVNENVVPVEVDTTVKADADGDGLNVEEEIKYGSDPEKADTDGDGYTDGEEVKNGYNPAGEGKLKK